MGTVTWTDPEDGRTHETSVKGGACKLQWKADWAMRWYALDVDYEMSGKDLIDSVKLSSRICRILGRQPPEGMTYELFLDHDGQKISKSRGNGLSVEDFLTYGPPVALSQFMYNQPQLLLLYFDVDSTRRGRAHREPGAAGGGRSGAPTGLHIHSGKLPNHGGSPVSFGMLLNLASVVNAETPDMLWGFIRRYVPGASPDTQPLLGRLIDHAIAYYRDFVRPAKRYRQPDANERDALEDLAVALGNLPDGADAESIQNTVFEVGKRHAVPRELPSLVRAACIRSCLASRRVRALEASSRCMAFRRRSR